MNESVPLDSDTPLGPVNTDDLKRVWHLIHNVSAIGRESSGIDVGLIAQHCEPGADAPAFSFERLCFTIYFKKDCWRIGARGTSSQTLFSCSRQAFPLSRAFRDLIPKSLSSHLREPNIV